VSSDRPASAAAVRMGTLMSVVAPRIVVVVMRRSYEGRVAGYRYYDGPEMEDRPSVAKAMEDRLYPGRPLQLRREPENPHDHKAIEVWAGKHKLGYIARADNDILSRLMDQQAPLEARIAEFRPDLSAWARVKVEVRMAAS
jgi:hypothetical protein